MDKVLVKEIGNYIFYSDGRVWSKAGGYMGGKTWLKSFVVLNAQNHLG